MKRLYQVCLASILLLPIGRSALAGAPEIAANLGFDQFSPRPVRDASVVFLSETTLALLLRPASPNASKIVILAFKDGQLRTLASTDKAGEGNQVFSVSDSRLIVAGVRLKYLYSQDLRERWELPMGTLCKQFPATDIVGESGPKGRRVFKLTVPPTELGSSSEDLLAVSSGLLVYQTSEAIRIMTAGGATRGSIPIAAGSRYVNNVEVAGPERIYFSAADDEHISDFTGKVLYRVQAPAGWGFRHGWNSDGSRLLFDHYLHDVPLGDRVIGLVADALGSVFPEKANSEVVRVIDVSTGAVCLNLVSNGKLFGQAGGYHADLSPSGRLVAVATSTELMVYRLPATCPNE